MPTRGVTTFLIQMAAIGLVNQENSLEKCQRVCLASLVRKSLPSDIAPPVRDLPSTLQGGNDVDGSHGVDLEASPRRRNGDYELLTDEEVGKIAAPHPSNESKSDNFPSVSSSGKSFKGQR